jgi:predicted kinase
MKISDQIRLAAETPREQLQDYSQEYLGTEQDPEDVLPVDEATEAEDADEVPPSEMEAITQGHKVVPDSGFLTADEKALLRRRGWSVVKVPPGKRG